MADTTAISWTDHTHNFVHGCEHAGADEGTTNVHGCEHAGADEGTTNVEGTDRSAECLNCYAEAVDQRFGGGSHWGPTAPRRVMGNEYWRKPLRWNAAAEAEGRRHRVFCSSMADVFETHDYPEVQAVLESQRARLWDLIRATPWLDWQLLTKRPENFRRYLPWAPCFGPPDAPLWGAPWPNVWLGVTIGVRRSMWRARILRETPALVRFVSGEPLLEHISGPEWDQVLGPGIAIDELAARRPPVGRIEWLIIGDEATHESKRRPCQPDWVRTAREAAQRHGVAFHFKQWNGPLIGGIGTESTTRGKVHLPILDHRKHAAIPEGIPVDQREPLTDNTGCDV